MVQIRVAHEGREYDIDMGNKGSSATDIKRAVAEELNLLPDNFMLKHGKPFLDERWIGATHRFSTGSSEFNDALARKIAEGSCSDVLLICDHTQGVLQEILFVDDIASTLMIERLPLGDLRSTEQLLVSFFAMHGTISRIILQQDETWQNMWALVVFARGTQMHNIPMIAPPTLCEHCTIRRLSDLEFAQLGSVHVLQYVADGLRHGQIQGQLGTALMRAFDDAAGTPKSRCLVRVIEEHAPLEALRAWVVKQDFDMLDAAFTPPSDPSEPLAPASTNSQGEATARLHPAFIHSKAKAGQIVHTAARSANALHRVPSRSRPGHTPGCTCENCRCGTRCSCEQCENASTATQEGDAESQLTSIPSTDSSRPTHNAGCNCKNCQCGRECSCANCAHWSR